MSSCQKAQTFITDIKTLRTKYAESLLAVKQPHLDQAKKKEILADLHALKNELTAKRNQLAEIIAPREIIAKNPFHDISLEHQKHETITLNFEKELEANLKTLALLTYPDGKPMIDLVQARSDAKSIWRRHHKEIKEEMEQYGYDTLLLTPADLPDADTLNTQLIETIEEDGQKVDATHQWDNFKNNGSFGKFGRPTQGQASLKLLHSAQNLAEHPLLRATKGKNIYELLGLDQTKEGDQKTLRDKVQDKADLELDFSIEIEGRTVPVKAKGLSIDDYTYFQRHYFEKTNQHLDVDGWTWLPQSSTLKGGSAPLVAYSRWSPGFHRLIVYANVPSRATACLGVRLSRSFS